MNDRKLLEAIGGALRSEIDKIVEEEAQKAAINVEKRIKERTASVVLTLLNNFSVERMGPELVIRVAFENTAQDKGYVWQQNHNPSTSGAS